MELRNVSCPESAESIDATSGIALSLVSQHGFSGLRFGAKIMAETDRRWPANRYRVYSQNLTGTENSPGRLSLANQTSPLPVAHLSSGNLKCNS